MLRLVWRLRPFIAAGAAVFVIVRGDTSIPVPDVRSLAVPVTTSQQRTPGTLVAITPIRVLDTRGREPLGGDDTRVDVLPDGAAPGEVTAVVLSVAVVGATEPTYVTIGPTGAVTAARVDAPTASASGMVIAAMDDAGAVTVTNAAGSAHVVIDVAGYVVAG